MAKQVIDALTPCNREECEELIRLSAITALWLAVSTQVVWLLT